MDIPALDLGSLMDTAQQEAGSNVVVVQPRQETGDLKTRHLQALLAATPETLLHYRWAEVLKRVHHPELLQPLLQHNTTKAVYRQFLDRLAESEPAFKEFSLVARDEPAISVIAGETAAAVAALYGSGDFAAGKEQDDVSLRAEHSVIALLREHDENPDAPLPATLSIALEAAVPAVVAAVFDRFSSNPPSFTKPTNLRSVEESTNAVVEGLVGPDSIAGVFAEQLLKSLTRWRSLAAHFSQRIVSNQPLPNLQQTIANGDLEQFYRRFGKSGAANKYVMQHLARVLAETPGIDGAYESYYIEQMMGVPREQNRTEHVTVTGNAFAPFPELKEVSEMDRGLPVPHKIALPEKERLFQPYLLFHNGYKVPTANGRSVNASLLELAYGLTSDTMKTLREVALGEAAVCNLSEEEAKNFYRSSVLPSLFHGRLLDGDNRAQQGVIASLVKEYVVSPRKAGKSGSQAAADFLPLLREEREKTRAGVSDWATGPRGLRLLLTAMGVDRPELSQLILTHATRIQESLAMQGLRPQSNYITQLAISPMRQDLARSLTGRTLKDLIEVASLPVPRTNGLKPGETLEKDADANYRLQRDLADRCLNAIKRPPSDEALAEIQVLFGYFIKGRSAYDKLQLQFDRSIQPPDRLGPGIVESLAGKTGQIRSAFFGTRFDNSARLKIVPDWRQRVDEVTVPPFTVAVVRGDYLATLLKASPAMADDPRGVVFLVGLANVFAKQSKSTDLIKDLSSWSSGFLRRIEKESGVEAAATMRARMTTFAKTLKAPFAAEAERILTGSIQVGCLSSEKVHQHLADAFLRDPLVAPLVKEVNSYYPCILSRYPVIHHHSYVSAHVRIGLPESNVVAIHPLIAPGLNADYDGDAGDMLFPLPYSATEEQAKNWREMMDAYSPTRAILNSASGTDWIYKLGLNASEGLVKANLCYVPANGLPQKDIPFDAATTETSLYEVLPKRDDLIHTFADPEGLLKIRGLWLEQLRVAAGRDSLQLTELVGHSDGSVTTLSRLFLHSVLSRLTRGLDHENSPSIEAALGARYLRPGQGSVTNARKVEEIIQKNCYPDEGHVLQPGDYLGSAYTAFYGFFSNEATTATHSVRAGTIGTPETFEYIARDEAVVAIRRLFTQRLSAVEQAWNNGVLSDGQAKSLLMRLENGDQPVETKEWHAILSKYRGASQIEEFQAQEPVKAFMASRMSNPAYGLKPLMKAAVRAATEKFAREFGFPHLLVEQLLTEKVKANDEVLYRFFMGTANLIDGEPVPTTFGGLTESPTAERILKSGAPALDKSVKSKTEVPATGTAFKDYEVALSSVFVTRGSDIVAGSLADSWIGRSRAYALKDYADSDHALNYLVQQLTLRRLNVAHGHGLSEKLAAEFTKRLTAAVEDVPFDRAAMVEVLKDLRETAPEAMIHVRSVLLDQHAGHGVSAESLGYLTVGGSGGLIFKDGKVSRQPMTETKHLGYPIGGMIAGALGEMATQAALRVRHVTGSGIEEYRHLGDWQKLVHGPYPQRSPFYRLGGTKLRSASPLAHEGLETSHTVFVAKVNEPDRALEIAKTLVNIGGVEVYPGEKYRVQGGQLIVGTNRPAVWSLPLNPLHKWTDHGNAIPPAKLNPEIGRNVEAIEPAEFQLRLTAEEAKPFGFDDPVASYRPLPQLGGDVRGIRMGTTVTITIPIQSAQKALDQLVKASGLRREQLAERIEMPIVSLNFVPVDPANLEGAGWGWRARDGLIRYRVTGDKPLNLGDGTPLLPGMVIDPRRGLAERSLENECTRGLQGFDAYLGYLNGKTLDIRAPLAEYTGTVTSVEFMARRGEANDFVVAIKSDDGVAHSQWVRMTDSNLPVVVPGQRIERGRPLGMGAVDLKEKCLLRGNSSIFELADYLSASSYGEGKRSPAPVVTEMIARSLFQNGQFTYIKDFLNSPDQQMGTSPWQLAGRAGRVEALLMAAVGPLMTPGFGRAMVIPDPSKEMIKQSAPSHLFPSKHPVEMSHASAVAEALAAIGLGTKLLEPLVNAAAKFTQVRAEADHKPKPASPMNQHQPSQIEI